jgi:hypothetical protein
MASAQNIDGVLVQWGDRLFYRGNRIVKDSPQPRLSDHHARERAAAIRARIEATVLRRVPQVMVKVTGGGRGMKAIAAHFRYISKNGRLDIEDQRGEVMQGKDALRELADEWRFGGSLIDDVADRREAFNIMLSMPRGTVDASVVHRAAREFAATELTGHKYVMVLHDHQANPHVHISVRAESGTGRRLNPRKADLQRWRETFAEKLRGWGIEAEATRQATRGQVRNYDTLWRRKARDEGRPHGVRPDLKTGGGAARSRDLAAEAWGHIARALAASPNDRDRTLARAVADFVADMPAWQGDAAVRRDVPATEQRVQRALHVSPAR